MVIRVFGGEKQKMFFKEGSPLYSAEVERRQGEDVLYVNYLGAPFVPSIADNPGVMARTIETLMENPNVSRVVFVQQRNYNYPYEQVSMLIEIASLYSFLTKQENVLSVEKLSLFGNVPELHAELMLVINLLKQDPIGCYLELKKRVRSLRAQLEKGEVLNRTGLANYIRLLEKIQGLLENTRLIKFAWASIEGLVSGSREIYKSFFRPDILPNFTFTRLVAQLPKDADLVDQYELVSDSENIPVSILKRKDDSKYIYHVLPPEYSLSEEHHMLLNLARNVLIEHRPKAEEFTDPEKTRQVFFNVSRDLLTDLSRNKGIELNHRELTKLSKILVRYTIGFGLIEVLLADEKLQDISINAPISQNPIFVRHEKYDECYTNIMPSYEDADSWAAKLRLQSGRPLDEANPILDTDLVFGNARARVAAIKEPLSPYGLAYSLRRHRDEPWTLPLFIDRKMINSFTAGLLSFMIDGNRTLLVAGTRSSGKCVDGETLIQISNGDIRKIKELIGEEKEKIDDGVICLPSSESYASSLDKMSIASKKISAVWKRNSPEKVVKIKTRSGKEIITTKEHPYFIYENGLQNKRADELKEGDLIASPRELHIEGSDVGIVYNADVIGESDENYLLRGKTNSSVVKFPKKLDSEIAYFIGLIIGDGHLDREKLEFRNQCAELRERCIFALKSFGVPCRVFDSRTTKVVQASSRALCRALNEIFEIPFGKKADKVKIPSIILKSRKEILSSFLRGYFDTDGYVPKEKRDIEIVSASKLMAEHLKLALLRFGIVSFMKQKKVNGADYFRTLIRGEFVYNFAREIGFNHPKKKERIAGLASKKFINNTNTDVIPCGNEILRELRRLLRTSPKELRLFAEKDYWAYENGKYRTTRAGFKKMISFYSKRHAELASKQKEIEKLRSIANFDIGNYFSNIERVRSVLGLSYYSLANQMGLSERAVRKILKNKRASLESVDSFRNLNGFFGNKIRELSFLRDLAPEISSLPSFVEHKVVSYACISRETAIPETSLKSYCLSNACVLDCKMESINNAILKAKDKFFSGFADAVSLFNYMSSERFMCEFTTLGVLISNFRNLLNIQNEEFAGRDLSIASVSNFFNAIYTPSFPTLKLIAKKIIEIYDSAVSGASASLLHEAEMLANSEIFWDEVSSVKIIDKVDEFVYDLTVDSTHNFVANGLIAHNTSLLGSMMLEIMPKFRVIVVEDTLELGVDAMRKLGYDILRMKVRSALVSGTTEVEAAEGIRASLRLGDSALIVGEVRSSEAKALYEAMRVGALANVVAGTIHGDSPYGVFDRVVNDLEVPATSFKATDLIVVANPVKTPDGMHSMKRVMGITEVRKHWKEDPAQEGGFVDLVRYNVEKDELEPTPELINGESVIIKNIAGNVKGWAGNWDAVYDNILLRGKMKQEVVELAKKLNNPKIMEANFNALCNSAFHRISESVREEAGIPSSERVFPEWKKWLYEMARGI